MPHDSDRQLARASEFLDRTRERYGSMSARARKRRQGEVLKRVGRIAAADVTIVIGAMLIGWFVPLGMGGALLVMALLIAATLALAIFPIEAAPNAETLTQVPLKALPLRTEQWLETQRPALPAPAKTLADSIGVKLETLAPQLAALSEESPAAHEVRKLIGEQLPELVKGYERVPEPLRGVERHGRTPNQQLEDGLKLIDQEIAEMSAQLAEGDLDLLATKGRYLQIKYQGDEAFGD
ncbi:HAD family hydrolase [Stakelama tenebrarum]|uniref:Uncharacterized protein n=1 Tax=Stakelama tenebrarum TaxID=2711215 RepID=A0A6G6Y8V1_9SPHN|nr:hypothetical protein [Sphingosinithalassobacter tenebrarum]QIG81355.1 hypothetical protein G5C33_17235 [Sphingosinithalassobacter tenebrarum]